MEKIATGAMEGVTTSRDGEEELTNDAGSKMPLIRFNQQRFVTHGVRQKCFQQNDVFRMTEIGHECQRDDDTVCCFLHSCL